MPAPGHTGASSDRAYRLLHQLPAVPCHLQGAGTGYTLILELAGGSTGAAWADTLQWCVPHGRCHERVVTP